MKTTTLSRSEMNSLQRDPGETAERLVSNEYQGFSRFGVENFDVSDNKTGKLGEVKSTATTLASGNSGRFRLWKDQHTKLVKADRVGTARYVFVLFDVESRPVTARMVERVPARVGHQIAGRGGFYSSGHPKGEQYKLPIDAVFR